MDLIKLPEALELFKLPVSLGDTADGEPVQSNIGRFGPYIKYGAKYVSLKPPDDPYTVDAGTRARGHPPQERSGRQSHHRGLRRRQHPGAERPLRPVHHRRQAQRAHSEGHRSEGRARSSCAASCSPWRRRAAPASAARRARRRKSRLACRSGRRRTEEPAKKAGTANLRRKPKLTPQWPSKKPDAPEGACKKDRCRRRRNRRPSRARTKAPRKEQGESRHSPANEEPRPARGFCKHASAALCFNAAMIVRRRSLDGAPCSEPVALAVFERSPATRRRGALVQRPWASPRKSARGGAEGARCAQFIVESVADFLIPFASDAQFAANRARPRSRPTAHPRLQQLPARSVPHLCRPESRPRARAGVRRRPRSRACAPSAVNTSYSAATARGAFRKAGDKAPGRRAVRHVAESDGAARPDGIGITVGVEMQRRQECNYLNDIEEVVNVVAPVESSEHPRARGSVPHARDGRLTAAAREGSAMGGPGGARRARAPHAAWRCRR